jgi:hypothetical protein
MTSQRKKEANRRNAQKSTGPRTDVGKSKVRFNALTHGLTAETVVLPHEDAAAYQDRLESWTHELNAPGKMGAYLAERAVRVSWQLDRADFHERDRLIKQLLQVPAERERALEMGVTVLMNKLFGVADAPDANGHPAALNLSDDGPADALARLKSSAEGCRRLIAEWAAIKDELDGENEADPGTEKSLADLTLIGRGRVTRLLGLNDGLAAFQAHMDRRVAALVEIQKLAQEAMFVRLLAVGRNDLDHFEDDPPVPNAPAAQDARNAIDPQHLAALKQQVRCTGETETRQLEALLAQHTAEEDSDTDIMAAFDDSPEGERVHRYQSRWSHLLFRTLDALEKHRKEQTVIAGDRREQPEGAENPTEAPEPVVPARDHVNQAVEEKTDPTPGPVAEQQPTSDLPPAPPITPGEPGPENRPPSLQPSLGSRTCSTKSGSQVKSAKQSHRAEEGRRTEGGRRRTEGGRRRTGDGGKRVKLEHGRRSKTGR